LECGGLIHFAAVRVIIARHKAQSIIIIEYDSAFGKWVLHDPDCVYINPQAFIFRNRVLRETPNSLAAFVLFHRL
jgi:hypothetical protein